MQTLGHWEGGSVTHPILINYVGFKLGAFRLSANALYHCAEILKIWFYLTNSDVLLFNPQFSEKETVLLIVWLQNDGHKNEIIS